MAFSDASMSRSTSESAFSLMVSEADVCMMNMCKRPMRTAASSGSAAVISSVIK